MRRGRRRATSVLVVAVLCGGAAQAAASDPPQPEAIPRARPVVAVDDTRTHGPTARNWIDLATDGAIISGKDISRVDALRGQLSIGTPPSSSRDVRAALAPVELYQFRARWDVFHSEGEVLHGPLTFGLQRYFPVDLVSLSPLAYAHFGVEFAVSTPWLSGRHTIPPAGVRLVHGADTELAQNGWSLRPASVYGRADFLACRSLYVQAGAAPELFVPAVGPNEYDLRYHGALGFSLKCTTGAADHWPKVSLEYLGRARLHAKDAPVTAWNQVGVGLQFDLGAFVIQALATTDPGEHRFNPWMLGLRLQGGFSKESR